MLRAVAYFLKELNVFYENFMVSPKMSKNSFYTYIVIRHGWPIQGMDTLVLFAEFDL